MGVVQLGEVQLGVVQLGSVQMGVDRGWGNHLHLEIWYCLQTFNRKHVVKTKTFVNYTSVVLHSAMCKVRSGMGWATQFGALKKRNWFLKVPSWRGPPRTNLFVTPVLSDVKICQVIDKLLWKSSQAFVLASDNPNLP